jgi:hypothetical protein
MKTTHAARAEAAAVRREEKKRQEKERILLVSLQLGCYARWTFEVSYVLLCSPYITV